MPLGERVFLEPWREETEVRGIWFPARRTGLSRAYPWLFWRYRSKSLEIADGDGSCAVATAGSVEVEVRLKSEVEEVLSRTLPEGNEQRTKTGANVSNGSDEVGGDCRRAVRNVDHP